MIHTWTWTYTLVVIVLLLSLFLLLGAFLLLCRARDKGHPQLSRYQATPESVSTPGGAMSYRVVNPQVSLDEGVRRAEHTSYFPRIERNSTMKGKE